MKEQIELIKENLSQLDKYRQDDWNYLGCYNDILRHLKSLENIVAGLIFQNDQLIDYKTMWEELKEEYITNWNSFNYKLKSEELEQKYGIKESK